MSTISIAMTVYNGIRFLEAQLDSLRLQTRVADEVVICDDYSTDGTADFVRDYIEQHSLCTKGWLFSVNERNLGWQRNFIHALAKTSGDIIFFCDQDDIWHPQKIEIMAAHMEARPDMLFLTGGIQVIDAEGKERVLQSRPIQGWTNRIERIPVSKKLNFCVFSGCTVCLRREVAAWMLTLSEQIIVSDVYLKAHDMQAPQIAALLDGAYKLDRPVLYYRIHESNASHPSLDSTKGKGTLLQRVENTKADLAWAEALCTYFSPLTAEQRKIIEKTQRFLHWRLRFLETGNIFYYLLLLRYCKYYSKMEMLFGDLVYCYSINRFAGKVYDCFSQLRNTHYKGKQA